MDLLNILRSKLDTVGNGEHIPGLRAVLLHIETAIRHLDRGRESGDETAFTDAIYRTNQAFEGSIKEAYRVLAEKSPERQTPSAIEKYLENNLIFRRRVLAQFTNYRQEWRNPSTHDYKLDFDEGEAFLSIVSVAAFACLLFDQIAERIAFLASKAETEKKPKLRLDLRKAGDTIPLIDKIGNSLLEFATQQGGKYGFENASEAQFVGTIAGYLSAIVPDSSISTEEELLSGRTERADIVIRHGDQTIVIELKRLRPSRGMQKSAITQLEHYLMLSNASNGVLYLWVFEKTEYHRIIHDVPHGRGKIVVIAPKTID